LKEDIARTNARLALFGTSTSTSGWEREEDEDEDFRKHHETFLELIETFHRPRFQLKSQLGAISKVPQGPEDESFFETLSAITGALLQVAEAPAGSKALFWTRSSRQEASASASGNGSDGNGNFEGNVCPSKTLELVLDMSEACLEVLQIVLVEFGPDLVACSDALKLRVEQSRMVFDYIVAKLIHATKEAEAAAEGEEHGLGVARVKAFVERCIETFSIQKKGGRKRGQALKDAAAVKKEKSKEQLLREEKIQMHQDMVSAKVKAIRVKNKRLKRSKNAFIDAALRGEGYHSKEDGDISDLEDFIVCKPGRDYDKLLERRSMKQMKQIRFRPRSDLLGPPPAGATQDKE